MNWISSGVIWSLLAYFEYIWASSKRSVAYLIANSFSFGTTLGSFGSIFMLYFESKNDIKFSHVDFYLSALCSIIF